MLTTYTVRTISNTDISDGYIIIYFMYLSGGVQLTIEVTTKRTHLTT